jgi:hypothetical protein
MKRTLNEVVEREVYTVKMAAFALGVSEKTFIKRFVATKKILPVVYDEEQGDTLYFAVEDVRAIVRASKRPLNESYMIERFGFGYDDKRAAV